ncbi:MAG TPA: glycosyltransferase [Sphingobacteriaceae bacterium]
MILLYLIFVFLVLRFTVTLFNFISNPKLTPTVRRYPDLVSVLIPVRNNGSSILRLLTSIKQQDHGNYEVLIYDYGSQDNTSDVCSKFCLENERFRMLPQKDLPVGWQRKNFASHQLAKESAGDYLMFLDARTSVTDGLVSSAIHRMKQLDLSLLSLFADQEMRSFGERLVIPLQHYLLLNLLPLRLVRLSQNASFAAASGQFMMFDAPAYRINLWHETVKGRSPEETEIVRLVKGYGERAETLLGNGFISSRPGQNFGDAVNELSSNILPGFSNSVIALLLYVFLVVIAPVAIYTYLDLELLFFAITLIVLSRIMISFSGRQNPWFNVLLHPLQMAVLALASVLAIQKYLMKQSVWRQRRKL